jgi:Protein of unknown function (DUF3500)
MGGIDEDSVFYYRVHSAVMLIEFDRQRGVALGHEKPSRNHIHTVVRTPNGNDSSYGSPAPASPATRPDSRERVISIEVKTVGQQHVSGLEAAKRELIRLAGRRKSFTREPEGGALC